MSLSSLSTLSPFQCQPFLHQLFPHQLFLHQSFPQEPFLQEALQHPPTYQSPFQHPPTYQSPFQYPPTQRLPVQYGPYPMGALPDPVPHQVTMHQRGQDLHAQDFNATVSTAPPMHAEQKVKGTQRGQANQGATAMSTESDCPTRNYRNPWVSNGEVWKFEVVVNKNQVKRIFDGQTDMGWYSFCDMACDRLSQPCDQVILGYKLTGNTGGMTELTCEPQWKKAMVHMREWIIASYTRAVAMELKNLHMTANVTKACTKGKDKPGYQTYCWPEPVAQGKMGGHHELSHEEMSLWAKQISEGKATKYLLPKTTKFNHPMTKKPKSGPTPPEVHIALNFTPTPGAGPLPYIVAGQQIVLSSMAPALRQSPPTDVSSNPVHTVNIPSIPGTQLYSAPAPQTEPSIRASWMRIILECCDASAILLVADLLTLMDQDHPTLGLNYVDTASEFNDLGVKDVLDVFAMPIELLASFGGLGRDWAHQLHEYIQYKILIPLGLLEEGVPPVETGGEASVSKVESGSSVVEVKGESSVIEVKCERSVVEVGGRGCGAKERSIVMLTGKQNQTQIESRFNSLDQGVDKYSWGEEGGWEEEADWDKRYNWGIGKEEEERVLEWLTGIREAGENNEGESDGSHEV
ncbi:hypothetical protein EI94DRAFT_1704965 [Lactarius quietus]|nr:hypothetical protein EI94DRAFT_1704965 [Lactarius quietus]